MEGNRDEQYMKQALQLAQKGEGYVAPNPMVGAVIVKDGRIIGSGYHEHYGGPHAEVNAIADAKEDVAGATMYVTLEPCPMCSGAIIQSRMKTVVFGAYDPKGGCIESCMKMYETPGFNHYPETIGGILEEECGALLKQFFRQKRKQKKANTSPK